jgi:signal transduction histidine kinase
MRVQTRHLLVDSAIALVLGWVCLWGALAFWGPALGRGEHPVGSPRFGPPRIELPEVADWIAVPLLLLVVGLAVRRIWPRWGFVAIVVGVGGYLAAGAVFPPVFVAPALGVYAMATALPLHRWVPLITLLVPMIMAGHWSEPYFGLTNPDLYAGLVVGGAVAVVPAMVALLRRSRRENDQHQREQDRRRYAYEERMRIARDVHDVVGHSLSVITMQAGVALHVLDKRPDQVAQSLEAIRTTSREALAELRMTLEIFRDPAAGEVRAPVPGLARLDDLVGALRQAGRTVEVVREPAGDQAPLPAAVDQAAFRIIQEALTNTVRHADSAAATVRVVRTPGWVVLEISDDGPTTSAPVAGNGIRGMGERARAVGGTVRIEPRPGGGVVVTAQLPTVEVTA